MTKITHSLNSPTGYMMALLHLMNQSGEISEQKAINKFYSLYKGFISSKDLKSDRQKRQNWEKKVKWAANNLISVELMSSDKFGIWIISETGRAWINEHPNDQRELRVLDREYSRKLLKVDNQVSADTKKIIWKGKIYNITGEELLEKARNLLAIDTPIEATSHQGWYAEVDGQRVSVLWLFHLITGAEYRTVLSSQACNILKKLGIPTYRIKKSDNKSIHWKGKSFTITSDELLDIARKLLATENPPEATRYKDWYAEVDGQHVSVKWLFHLITGAEYLTFMSNKACAALNKIGIPTYKNKEKKTRPRVIKKYPILFGYTIVLKQFDRGKFFTQITALLPEKLPAFARHFKFKYDDRNFLQISYPELIRSHYEVRLGRSEELAFHFEAPTLEANLARLDHVKPFENIWKAELGEELRLEQRGELWAQICLEWDPEHIYTVDHHWQSSDIVAQLPSLPQTDLIAEALKSAALQNPSAELWDVKARAYTDVLARFIEVTLPELQNAFPLIRRRRKKTAVLRPGAGGQDEHAHRFFDEKITEIRNFLQGRSPASPSHEVLCDWIQLCYLFGLFDEGQNLLPFVNETELNNEWLYRRTKKYAGVCRLNAARRS